MLAEPIEAGDVSIFVNGWFAGTRRQIYGKSTIPRPESL
jgi:hypothetical protein